MIKNFNDYQDLQQRTAKTDNPKKDRLVEACLGLAGETGEVIDQIKKEIFHDHPHDINKIGIEMGDVLWYLSEMCSALDIKLEDVADRNIVKLQTRYPDGFDPIRSKNRKEEK